MAKRFIMLLLAVSVSAGCLFSASLLQLGGYASYSQGVLNEAEDLELDGFSFGPEVRVNLGLFSFDMPATAGFTTDGKFTAGLMPSVNLSKDFTRFVDIALGAGLQLSLTRVGEDTWYVNNKNWDDYSNVLLGASPFYRLALTFNLPLMSLGASVTVQSKGTLEDFDLEPEWEQTKISLSVLWNFL